MIIKLIKIFMIILLFINICCSTQKKNNIDFIGWYNNNEMITRTINNGYWSNNSKDAPTNEELGKILDTACKVPTAVNWNEFFFIVVRDAEEQAAIVGDYWGKNATSKGTVTVLILADQITGQKNHQLKYEGLYMPSVLAYFDAGMASSLLSVAANTLGYNTHFFCMLSGKSVVKSDKVNDFGTPEYDITRFVKDRNYIRSGGISENSNKYKVEGNCILIGCVVIGKPDNRFDAVSSTTHHNRPKNWVIWEPNEKTPPLK